MRELGATVREHGREIGEAKRTGDQAHDRIDKMQMWVMTAAVSALASVVIGALLLALKTNP